MLQTLGFRTGLIARMILVESSALAIAGGLVGSVLAVGALRYASLSLSVDGLSIPISANFGTLLIGLGISVALGIAAGMLPAWQASRREIVACFRAV